MVLTVNKAVVRRCMPWIESADWNPWTYTGTIFNSCSSDMSEWPTVQPSRPVTAGQGICSLDQGPHSYNRSIICLLCRTMACFERNLHNQISSGNSFGLMKYPYTKTIHLDLQTRILTLSCYITMIMYVLLHGYLWSETFNILVHTEWFNLLSIPYF